MSLKDLIIPFPPGHVIDGRKVVGVMPCLGHDCPEWMVVRLDKKGRPSAYCDKLLTVRGCTRHVSMLARDIPVQTVDRVLAMRGDLVDMPREYLDALSKAWTLTTTELMNGCAEVPAKKPENLSKTAGHGGNPAPETTGDASSADAGTDDTPAGRSGDGPAERPGPDDGNREHRDKLFGFF